MDRFANVVLGYHGNSEEIVTALLSGTKTIANWPSSKNDHDWLGEGIYFWENSPQRAMRWATDMIKKRPSVYPRNSKPATIGAVIQLNPCFDLTDVASTDMLRGAYTMLDQTYRAEGKLLPENKRGKDLYLRSLDCLVINTLLAGDKRFNTVRGVFLEGDEAYPGAMIRRESQIQIAVREPSCILGIFRPNLKG